MFKQSISHKSAVDAKLAADKKQRNEQSVIDRGLQKMDEKTLRNMDKLCINKTTLASTVMRPRTGQKVKRSW